MADESRVAEITMRVRWYPGEEKHPGDWEWPELLRLQSADDFRLMREADVDEMGRATERPDQTPLAPHPA